jgi:hypothetical protein
MQHPNLCVAIFVRFTKAILASYSIFGNYDIGMHQWQRLPMTTAPIVRKQPNRETTVLNVPTVGQNGSFEAVEAEGERHG